MDGTFTTEVLPAVPGLIFDVIYNPNSVVLMVSSVGVPGDYNQNGVVDAADYTVWQDTLGSTTALAADGDASGTIDAADYDLWKTHFGETSAAAATASPSVPEPATAMLLTILMTTCAMARQITPPRVVN